MMWYHYEYADYKFVSHWLWDLSLRIDGKEVMWGFSSLDSFFFLDNSYVKMGDGPSMWHYTPTLKV